MRIEQDINATNKQTEKLKFVIKMLMSINSNNYNNNDSSKTMIANQRFICGSQTKRESSTFY